MTRKSKRRKGRPEAPISAAVPAVALDVQAVAERPDEPDAAAPTATASTARTDIERADERKTGSIETVTGEPELPPLLEEK